MKQVYRNHFRLHSENCFQETLHTHLPLLEIDGMHVYIIYTIAGEKAELKPWGERVGWGVVGGCTMEGGRDVSCVVERGEKEGWWLLCRAEKKQNMGRGWVGVR